MAKDSPVVKGALRYHCSYCKALPQKACRSKKGKLLWEPHKVRVETWYLKNPDELRAVLGKPKES